MEKLIASGTKGNLKSIENYESQFAEHQEGTLKLNCSTSFGLGSIAAGLNSALEIAGVQMPEPVKTEGKTIVIRFRKGFPWLALIVAAIIGLSVLYIILTNWELFKSVAPAIPWLIVIGVLALLGVYLYAGYNRIRGGST